jgi:HlyD family secretion protein
VTVSITASGTINPVMQVNIGTEVSGKIDKIYKDFNDRVKKGELLAKLDTSNLEMALEDARIDLKKIQLSANENLIDLNSAKELFEQEMISQYELNRAQYNYDLAIENIEKAKFSVKRAETNLNNAIIYSPIDGVIISRSVDEGQTVAASLNTPTLYIIANNLEEMQIEAQIDEADIGKVKNDQRVRFSIDAFPDLNFWGRVKQVRLNPIMESGVVTYKVIISVNNPDGVIMPGMTANVEIIIDSKRDILTINERALQFRPTKEIWDSFKLIWDEKYSPQVRVRTRSSRNEDTASEKREQPEIPKTIVWILVDNMPKQAEIEVGLSDGNFIEVISGINENDEIIIGVNQPMTQASGSAFGSNTPQMRMRF